MKRFAILAAILLLLACGGGSGGAGGVTAEESRALDEAAQMIESRQLPPEALAPIAPAPSHSAVPPAVPTR